MAQKGGGETNLKCTKGVVDTLVSKLMTNFRDFNISEIIKGGSLGHGTAVPGTYDIDLVIYSRDIKPEEVYAQNGFKEWIGLLKSFVERNFTHKCKTTGRSVQFTYKSVEVDLLVSPYWNTAQEFFQFLKTIPKERRGVFTVSASKWQVEFFRSTENQVKEYIKKAKAWRNREWSVSKHGRPSSYLMSLLVVKAYANCDHSGSVEVTKALKELVKHSSLNVYWADRIYKIDEYLDLLPPTPRIIDPANPANNVWKSGFRQREESSVLVSKIDSIDLHRAIDTSTEVPSIRNSKAAVHELAEQLKINFQIDRVRFKVNEIVKVGSLGHGTSVPGHFDIDLIIYSGDIDGYDILKNGYGSWLERLAWFIRHHCSNITREVDIKTAPYGSLRYSVNFIYHPEDEDIEIDLYVSPYWATCKDFYKFLMTVPRRRRALFYGCAAKWQNLFIQQMVTDDECQVVLEYIRTAKIWRNITWTSKMNGRPKSYLLTLLVIRAHENAIKRCSEKPKAADVTEELVELVKFPGNQLNVYWADGEKDFYRRRDYPSLLPPRPRVVDPANPSRNVWATGFDMLNYRPGKRIKGGKSKIFKQKIDTLDLSHQYIP